MPRQQKGWESLSYTNDEKKWAFSDQSVYNKHHHHHSQAYQSKLFSYKKHLHKITKTKIFWLGNSNTSLYHNVVNIIIIIGNEVNPQYKSRIIAYKNHIWIDEVNLQTKAIKTDDDDDNNFMLWTIFISKYDNWNDFFLNIITR